MTLQLLKRTTLITCISLLISVTLNAQTTYTYTGTGNWDTEANWSPSYPGAGDIQNSGDTVINNGTINLNIYLQFYADIFNNGVINNSFTTIIVSSIINNGEINNNVSKNFLLTDLTNYGTINNAGSISTSVYNNEDGGIINNFGILYNQSSIDQFTLEVFSGMFNNKTGAILDNKIGGIIQNYEWSIINNFGTLINSGIIKTNGDINNYDLSSLNNSGIVIDNGGIAPDISQPNHHPIVLTNTGTISGTNTASFSHFFNEGTLSPGNPIGVYTNDFYFSASVGIIELELASSSDFDKVILDYAELSGTLNVSLINGYTPTTGNTFTIITASSGIIGAFDTINLPAGYTWNVISTTTAITLEVTSTLNTPDFDVLAFNMYPNPAKDTFTIELEKSITIQKVNIYNTIGQLVLTTKESQINTSKLTSGLYTVEVVTDKGKNNKKLIIQ